MRTLLFYFLALCAVGAGLRFGFPEWFGVTNRRAEASTRTRTVPPVVVAVVGAAPFTDAIEALGTVRANESVLITANRSERITAIHFADGEHVEQGQLLLELRVEEIEADLAEAEAILAQRQAVFARNEELLAQGVSSPGDFDAAKADLAAAAARVQGLTAAVADHKVMAPFAGTLGLRRVSVGAFLQPSTVVTTLDDLSTVKVDFTIPGTALPSVTPEMLVKARSEAWPETVFRGRVATVDTRLDDRSRSATVRALLPNREGVLRPGMLLVIQVDRGEEPVLQVPEEALIPVGDQQFVVRVEEDSVAHRVEVEVGRRRVGTVEILGGLEVGDRVVVEGIVSVQSGAAVDVVSVRQVSR